MPKEDGVILQDGVQIASTKQCPHCGMHFVMKKGSGKIRGFCTKCHGITCGKLECCACIPFEKKLDMAEAGKIILA